jgi:CRISPR/Cas system CSM-associated protein Csm3 (group 7 of RAMP superfamily)
MSFANPYNFVSVSDKVERTKLGDIKDHNQIHKGTFSGQLRCSLKTLTKLFIPSTLEEDITENIIGKDNKGKPIRHRIFQSFYYIDRNGTKTFAIPASSLKGAIRSVAEAISNSCFHMFDGEYEKGRISYSIYDSLKKDQCVFSDENGNLADGLCICCSMFGMANAKESKDEGNNNEDAQKIPNVFRGKVRFSDAELITKPDFEPTFSLRELSSPKPHHKNFYANNKFIKGRKFYYHHNDYIVGALKGTKTRRNRSITPLKKDALFQFTVIFENLTKEEYGLLLTALELEPGLGHKIGMGKPLGLGSCVIEVTEIKEFTKSRYLSMGKVDAVKVYKGDGLKERKEKINQGWPIPHDLKCILSLNPGFKEIRYPKKDIHNSSEDEFIIYKKLHPPCREFSCKDKQGGTPVFNIPKDSKGRMKTQHKGSGVIAEAFKRAKMKKKRKKK